MWFDLWKINVFGNVRNLLGARKQVDAYWVVRGIVRSCTFLLISEKQKLKSEVRYGHPLYQLDFSSIVFHA